MPYTLTAANCPAPQALGTAVYSDDYCVSITPGLPLQDSPYGYSGVTQSAVGTISSSQVNYSLAQLSQVAKYGAGGYGVASGYTYSSATGLTVTVAAGIAMIDGPVESKTSQTIVVDDNASVWVWLKQDGTLTKSTSTSVPTGGKVALFRVTTSGGSVTANDQSGVVSIVPGGGLWRQTADAGAPTDSPPASIRLYTLTAGGVYFWDGTRHLSVGDSGRQAFSVASGNVTLTLTQCMGSVLEATGTPGTARTVNVLPIDGKAWDVYNASDSAVTFKVTGLTGITVATTKRARLYCNGTDIFRVSADA